MEKYKVIWLTDKSTGILFPGPLTKKEAETCASKVTKYSWRTIAVIPV